MEKKARIVLLVAPLVLPACGTTEETAAADSPATSSTTVVTDEDNPGYIDCIQTPAIKPEQISLDCASDTDFITNIQWDSWTATAAVGTGTRVQKSGDTTTESDVEISLSQPVPATTGWAFSAREVSTLTTTSSSAPSSAPSSKSSTASADTSTSSARPALIPATPATSEELRTGSTQTPQKTRSQP